MRILIIATFFPPQNSIASLRPYSWAKYWAAEGHEVTVLTTKKNAGEVMDIAFSREGFRILEVEQPKLISFVRGQYCQTLHQPQELSKRAQPKRGFRVRSVLFKAFDYLRHRFGIFSSCRFPDFTHLWVKPACQFIKGLGEKWDLVVSTAGPYPVHMIAHELKRIGIAQKWAADYRDLWVQNHIYKGMFPFTFFEKRLEKRLLQSADLVTTVSEPLAKTLRLHYPWVPVEVIENGFDSSDLENLSEDRFFEQDGKWRLVHTGTIYPGARDPSPLFKAVAELRDDPLNCHLLDKLEMVFVGRALGNLSELVQRYGVASWVQTGYYSRQDVLRMQKEAHALLLLSDATAQGEGMFTGKVFEYLFSGTPILAVGMAQENVAAKLITESGAGLVVGCEVEKIIRYLCEKLADVKKTKIVLPANVLGRFERKALAGQLLQFIMEM